METSQFDYQLPSELIAQRPLKGRADSRLLEVCQQAKGVIDRRFTDLANILRQGDLLVFNNTRVIPARLFGHKESGGKLELLIERLLPQNEALCHIKASKAPREGTLIMLEVEFTGTVIGREGDLFRVRFDASRELLDYLSGYGHMPLPPYIDREDDEADLDRYQTVYATQPGAVAAPTAGLHFDDELIERLKVVGVDMAYVTLHVGAGTFQPVRVDRIEDHKMHSEWIEVSEALCERIRETKQAGGRVIAVGTTVVRSLETACGRGELNPFMGDTNIFITPGYSFKCIDALITNFHLPCSTLLMLVCAFGGYEPIMQAYQHAIKEGYRFFSYGDAMFIENGLLMSKG